ncbi:CocE/NonD family hydrolase [Devosia sp. RR2S18]|uniref:CocE/NonD family hydrolase n=1 Tax=Devosia rhizosphaerae TaxID=3049774 RepID=UPI00253FC3CA|nr:CocE/NonD family hydrolase [Devosia sp. RR2S18]WIJ26233.1 CocE/NonD family hydrolase [Devosia sp. RR2S18]
MSVSSFFLAYLEDLPPRTNSVKKTRSIPVTMSDGVVLLTDHYAPRLAGQHPTLLMRLPYGRQGFGPIAEAYAERGFHVVIQACRGTEKSGGEFDPLVNERSDGLATLDWLKGQPWYDGRLGLSGPSYLGYAQWAISDALPPVSAMATKVTTADFRSVVFPAGAFHLQLWLSWLQVVEGLRRSPLRAAARMVTGTIERKTAKASNTLPLKEADVAAVGKPIGFWRRWFDEAIGNEGFWDELDHRHRMNDKTPPVHFISGWYDFMLDQLLSDYQRLIDLGHQPYLTVGTWFHVEDQLQRDNLRETLLWMRAKLLNDASGLREKPVRIHVSGEDEWREFDCFPPPGAAEKSWFLAPGRVLSERKNSTDERDFYRYDPAEPTPNVGGAIFAFTGAGMVDNKPREERADVRCYTGEKLTQAVTVIGKSRVTLTARASLPDADFFVRLCDVGTDGMSRNICDGLVRVTPETPTDAEGNWHLEIGLHATAHSFLPGHRLRLQVSSGAHPRYARNMGTGEPISTATKMEANDIEISLAGSALSLPVYGR